jgi:hypothetical protein
MLLDELEVQFGPLGWTLFGVKMSFAELVAE